MILASHFGWETVTNPALDFHDYLLMGQLLSEERIGSRVRHSRGVTQAHESDRMTRLRKFTPE